MSVLEAKIAVTQVALVVVGGRRRRRTDGARGMAVSVLGGLLVVGSIWAAFVLGDLLGS